MVDTAINLLLLQIWLCSYDAGIDVGYQFYSRAEMVALGFHSHWLSGIDYIGKSSGAQVIYLGLLSRR